MRCIFKDEECPVACGDKQKKCWIVDFTQSEEYISDREICIGEDEKCPCGQNTQRCPGSDTCLLPTEASLACPCEESKKQRNVVDYTSSAVKHARSVHQQGCKMPVRREFLDMPGPEQRGGQHLSPEV